MVISAAILGGVLGVQGDKYRKEFRTQANLYRPAFEKLADNLVPALEPLLAKGANALCWAKLAGCSVAFAHGAVGVATLVNVYTGIKAQQELQKFYTKLGHDVEAIKSSLEAISRDVEVLATHKAQSKFGEHVYDYIKMRRDQLSTTPGNHLLFVYHPGTEWYAKFNKLNTSNPLSHLAGYFDNLDIMAAWLQVVRKIVGPEPTFHIILLATEDHVITEPLSWPQEIQPMIFEGEKRNRTGTPYFRINIPDVSPEMFLHVHNLASEVPVPPPARPSVWKKVASTSAAWAAGLPAAMVATPGGMVCGLVGCAVLAPLAPIAVPGAAIVGAVCGTGVAAGAAAGTITGLFVGEKVEKFWDDNKIERT